MKDNVTLIKTIQRKTKKILSDNQQGEIKVENGIAYVTIRIEKFEDQFDEMINKMKGLNPFTVEMIELTRDKLNCKITQEVLERKIKELENKYNISPRKS